jgi:hypothetical protein
MGVFAKHRLQGIAAGIHQYLQAAQNRRPRRQHNNLVLVVTFRDAFRAITENRAVGPYISPSG